METKFGHKGTKTQRKHEELRNERTAYVCMTFFVPRRGLWPSCLRGIFGSGSSVLDSALRTPRDRTKMVIPPGTEGRSFARTVDEGDILSPGDLSDLEKREPQ